MKWETAPAVLGAWKSELKEFWRHAGIRTGAAGEQGQLPTYDSIAIEP